MKLPRRPRRLSAACSRRRRTPDGHGPRAVSLGVTAKERLADGAVDNVELSGAMLGASA